MAGKASNNGFLDASPIERLIAKTRRLLRSGWVLTGLGLSLGLRSGERRVGKGGRSRWAPEH